MEIKKEVTLETTANKIGCVFLLARLLLYGPALRFVEKFLDFNVVKRRPSSIAWIIALLLPSLFLLKVNPKEMLIGKRKKVNFKFKSLLLLTIFFISFDRLIAFTYVYGTGYYKLYNAMPLISNTNINSSNIIIMAISILIPVVWEEIIYRGIVLENLRKHGDVFAIVAAGVLFGIVHGQLIIVKSMSGIILGILYVMGGNIKWPICVHYLINMGSGIPGILSNTIALKFPQVTDVHVDLGILVFNFIIMIISLLLCLKDNILKPLFHRCSVKNISKQFKMDKSKYKEFFTASAIVFSIVIELIIVISVFSARMNIYFKR